MTWTPKDPSEVIDLTIDWSDTLATGDEIDTSTWSVPAGITEDATANTTTTTTITVSGGTDGESYLLTNLIVTTGGKTHEQTRTVSVLDNASAAVGAANSFAARFPEFSGVALALLVDIIAEADADVADADTWGSEAARTRAVRLLAAHMLAREGEPERSAAIAVGAAVAVQELASERVGDTAWTYAAGAPTSSSLQSGGSNDYTSSRYGKQYLEHARRHIASVMTT